MKSEHIVRYTAAELKGMRERGETRTDWGRVDAMTEEELEASIDVEEEGEIDWSTLQVGFPSLEAKRQLTLRVDHDVVEWFKSGGKGYQTRMNAVLRSYVDAQKR